MNPYRIEKLGGGHRLEGFDCGREELNLWLRKHGLHGEDLPAPQSYGAVAEDVVLGYYSLAVGQMEPGQASEEPADRPVPVMLLPRLAVDRESQGKGVGAALLRDAVLRTLRVAEIGGIRALVAYAGDERGCAFYRRFDFVASRVDPWLMVLRVGDVLGSAAR